MKKKILIGLSSLLAFASVVAINGHGSNLSSFASAAEHGSTCQWSHYSELHPTYTENGVKEYWICCNHHNLGPVFSAPTTGKITNKTHDSSFRNTITESDERYLKPYNQPLDFSDGYLPSIFTANSNVKSLTVENGELKTVVKNGSFALLLDKYYLDQVFSDPSIVAINFDAKADYTTNNFRRHYYDPNKSAWTNRTYEYNNTIYGITTNWKPFTYTRDYYNIWKEGEQFIVGGNCSENNYFVIDNITPVRKPLDYYGFENGGQDGTMFNSPGHSDKGYIYYQAPTMILKQTSSSGIFVNQDYDYDHKTEGRRSARITKNNGYMAFYLRNDIQSSLGEDDYVLIDIMTSFKARGDNEVLNFLDGANGPTLVRMGNVHPADTWVTYAFRKNQISSDGRFLIVQGSTAGDLYFDNVRIAKHISNKNLGLVEIPTGSDYTFSTKNAVDTVDSVIFNGVSLDLSQSQVTFSANSYTIDNSLIKDGVTNDIIFTYRSGDNLYSETTYIEFKQFTPAGTVDLSINYGDSSYYKLSGYSGIYRITCNDKEVPFEIDGSNYLIPKAALVQLLNNNGTQAASGLIHLELHALTGSSVLPINLTVNNANNARSITNYNGDGITTHAYSFSAEFATNSTYYNYLDRSDIATYDNVGYEVIYEQRWHVLANDTSLSDQLVYLLDNAYAMGKKVILSDDVFSKFAKDTSKIIGRTFTNIHGNSSITISSTSVLDNLVEQRLKLYINHPAFYGFTVCDEPFYNHLINGYSDIRASIDRVLTKLGRDDVYVGVNLLPVSCVWTAPSAITGNSADVSESDDSRKNESDSSKISTRESQYLNYLNAYYQNTPNCDYVQFDIYPFADNEKGWKYEGKGLDYYYLENMAMVASWAKEKDLEFKFVAASVTYYGSRLLDRKDISWINNMILGFGIKHISYFVYCVRGISAGPDSTNEQWVDTSAPLNGQGEKTDIYYYYQAQLAEINQFAPVISNFEFDWLRLYSYSFLFTKPNKAKIYTNLTGSGYYSSSSSYGEISSVSTSKDWTFVTGLVSKTDSKKMYMIQNVYNDFDSELLQTVTITFDKSYTYAIIYEAGLPRVVNLGSKKLELKLSVGKAAFLMVY